MFKKIATAAFASSVSASINIKFQKYISGEEMISYDIFEQMWTEFESEFTSPMTNKNSFIDRKQNFADKVKEIILFNKDPSNTYKKGINEYSDMTDEEFNEYFRINTGVKAEQHCSATN